jgi:hypothetical protein
VPELLEVETYRRQAEAVVGRTVASVHAPAYTIYLTELP